MKPDYGKDLPDFVGLEFTISAIFEYSKNNFKAKNLAAFKKRKNGYCFAPHLLHLYEAGFLSRMPKNLGFAYTVIDLKKLRKYHKLVLLLAYPPDDSDEKIETLIKKI